MKKNNTYRISFVLSIVILITIGFADTVFSDDDITILKEEADALYKTEQYEQAVELYLSIMKDRDINQTLAAVLSYKAGRCYERMNDLSSAVRYYYLSLRINKELNNFDALSSVYYRLGTALYNKGDRRRSVTAFENSFTISKALGNDKLTALSSFKLGVIYYELGDNGLSLRYFMHSLDYNTEQKNLKSAGIIMYYIGNIYFDEGKLDDAVYIWKRGLHILKGTGSEDWKMIRDKLLEIAD